ncbi:pentatricopeptide repeat-containing protein At5g50990 [Malania oleifera]|uniref:pentatricopeptide repeat-containing protein At5g50990 n=1 Tax=Malania oleifera TaxID=397392 RepID=UPI0025AEAD21|nr:pentatricopeptide repeat-containing protein At5g50990 [Malania oleifera]
MMRHGAKRLCNVQLQVCKLSSDCYCITAIQTHARIVKLGYYGTRPSLLATLISAYAYCNRPNIGSRLIDEITTWGFDLMNANSILTSLTKSGDLHIAREIFDKMPARDVVTWNAMIAGCQRNVSFQEGFRLFRRMLGSNVEPDGFTFASLIAMCARVGSIKLAEWVHGLVIEKRIELNAILSSALIDAYSKCGKIRIAKEVFDSVQHGDVCVWNAMINGLAIHGHALDAITLFSQMELENVPPDSITLLAILKACSHCGLVEQGRKYFDLMSGHYSIQPQLEHYGAMVDLLARAGLLGEACAIIKAMPMKPDVVIWRAILSACRTHKNPELGKVAIAKISCLKSGDYVLLSNLYCSLKNWDDAGRVREFMRRKRVHKNRGKSWVEVAGVIHQFKASDRSHSETESIYKLLEALIRRVKLEGFTPTTELVFMDVLEEEKEGNLHSHSEKLALAYGLLKSSPGTEIRILKNLRICDDCHCWMKIVSRVLGRVIILRDRIRFHQFENGLCSCGDYW